MTNGLMELPQDFKSLLRLAQEQGWEYSKTTSGHHRFINPQGRIVMHSGTPSDFRSIKNFRAEMKRHGLRPYTTLVKEEKVLIEPKLVVSKVVGDSTTPIPPVGAKKRRSKNPAVTGGKMLEAIKQVLRKNDTAAGKDSNFVAEEVAKILPGFEKKNLSGSLTYYVKTGMLTRVAYGQYRLTECVKGKIELTEDDDFKVLEEVLAALAKAEGVIRRMQQRAKKLEELKAALAAIK